MANGKVARHWQKQKKRNERKRKEKINKRTPKKTNKQKHVDIGYDTQESLDKEPPLYINGNSFETALSTTKTVNGSLFVCFCF